MFHPKQGVGFLQKEVSTGFQKSLVVIKRWDGELSQCLSKTFCMANVLNGNLSDGAASVSLSGLFFALGVNNV